jgi:hypothetical protein
MLGFTVPLFVLAGVETVLGVLLLAPKPFNAPAVLVMRLTKTQVGKTVINTLALMLLCLLAAPLYDIFMLHKLHESPHADPNVVFTPERRYRAC